MKMTSFNAVERALLVTSANGLQRRSTRYIEHLLSSGDGRRRPAEVFQLSALRYGDFAKKGLEPSLETIERGLVLMKRMGGFDHVIGVGGPAVMDIGRSIAALHSSSTSSSISSATILDTAKELSFTQSFESPNWRLPSRTLSVANLPFIAVPTVSCLGSEVGALANFVDWKNDIHFKLPVQPPRLVYTDAQLVKEDNIPVWIDVMMWIATLARYFDSLLMNPELCSDEDAGKYARVILQSFDKMSTSGKEPTRTEQNEISMAAISLSSKIHSDKEMIEHMRNPEKNPLPWHTLICETIASHLPLSYSNFCGSAALWLQSLDMTYADERFRSREKIWKFITRLVTGNEKAEFSDTSRWIIETIGPVSFPHPGSNDERTSGESKQQQREFLVEHILLVNGNGDISRVYRDRLLTTLKYIGI